ncbi:hypothetical protein BJ166DRAFT_495767 [Pestalotiopsis sp. NC0098]|nr:hypothetical protein BJ166DRAFT_495767 [Pestalotiopsis sp. NC0098]
MSRIDLGLSRPDDDANEKKLTTALDDLVHDELDAASAARLIDDIITKDCQKALAAYNSISEELKKNDTVAGPVPQGWQQYLYDCLATAAMKIPADHSGQERLVDLLEELGRLPRHTVPVLYFEPERIAEKELWVLTRENNYDGFGQLMWERHEGTFLGWRQVETDPDAAVAYRNFSAFLARLLSRGTAALLGLSALVSPFVTRNIVAAASHEPHRFEPYVAAAAQWILYGGEVLHQMCEMRIMASVRWKKELWDRIRTKFDAVAGDARFGAEARGWAAQAAGFMRKTEEKGSGHKRDAVDRHRFLQLEEG